MGNMMNRVTFKTGGFHHLSILVNGAPVGFIESAGREVWAYVNIEDKDEFLGRFKYHKPMSVARYSIRKVFEMRSPAEVLAKIKTGVYLVKQLEELGIPHYFAREGAPT